MLSAARRARRASIATPAPVAWSVPEHGPRASLPHARHRSGSGLLPDPSGALARVIRPFETLRALAEADPALHRPAPASRKAPAP